MGAIKYFCRIIPGLSIIAWTAVCYLALVQNRALPWSSKENAKSFNSPDFWQWTYIIYSLLAHISACLVFPVRLVYSVWQLIDEVRNARFEAAELSRPYDVESETASSVDDKSSNLSIPMSNASTLANTPEQSLSRIGTPKLGYFDELPAPVTHAIILPSYKEEMSTMRETLLVLSSHVLAKSSYDIYLAMEKRDPDGVSTANVLIDQFQHCFKTISYTVHPDDIVGEVAGKSSNVSWAAKTLSHNYSDPIERRNTIITVMDSDTHFPSSYFLLMSKAHRENPDSDMSLYTCPLCFDRNSHQVNALVRTADIFWCGAGLSGMYRGSSVKIPTSVYSVAMPLAGRIGGWDTGPESIGEDMHTYLKSYFATKGKADTCIIFTPASQCNVSVDAKGAKGFLLGVWARYQQALRHMWGCLDTGFAVQKGLECLFRVENTNATWLSDPEPETRLDRWMDGVEHFSPPNMNIYDEPQNATFNKWKLMLLYHRLYEAHFLPAHLTIALFSAVAYTSWVPQAATHPILLSVFSFCGTMRFIGLMLTCVYLYIYEGYHRICVKYREDEMKKAGLYEDMKSADGFAHRSWRTNWVDYCCLPATGMLFGTMPAVAAYIRHFYTDKLLYTVSAKPQTKITDKLGEVANKVASTADAVADKVKLDRIIDNIA